MGLVEFLSDKYQNHTRLDLFACFYHAVFMQIVLLCIAGAFLSIDINRQLVDYDEATYAKVVVDTLHTGQVTDLYHFDKPWFEKPPLYLWMAVGSVKLFGSMNSRSVSHQFSPPFFAAGSYTY